MNKFGIGCVLCFALAIGYGFGWWTSRGDLKSKDEEIARLTAAQAHAATDSAKHPSTRHAARSTGGWETPAENREGTASAPAPRRGDMMMMGFFGGNTSSNFVAQWQAQAVAERSNLFANAGLSPEQQAHFDSVIGEMNEALKDKAAFWTEAVKEGKISGPEIGLRMMNDFSAALVQAYDGMDKGMPPNWREKANNNFNVIRFMDPTLRDAFRALRQPRGSGPGAPPAP